MCSLHRSATKRVLSVFKPQLKSSPTAKMMMRAGVKPTVSVEAQLTQTLGTSQSDLSDGSACFVVSGIVHAQPGLNTPYLHIERHMLLDDARCTSNNHKALFLHVRAALGAQRTERCVPAVTGCCQGQQQASGEDSGSAPRG